MDQRYPIRLALVKETDAFHIYEIELLQIQNDRRFAALDFAFDLVQMLKSKIAAYSNPSAHRVNSQGHRIPASRRHIGIRNRFATSKYLQMGNLRLLLVLNIQESPSYKEMRALSQVLVSA